MQAYWEPGNITAYDPPARRQTVQMVRDGDEVVINANRLGEWSTTEVKLFVLNGILMISTKQDGIDLVSQLAKLRKD